MVSIIRAGIVALILAAIPAASAHQGDPADTPVDVSTNLAINIFDPPRRLAAVDGLIDSSPSWGHSGPCLHDGDGDGRRDLLVGDFSGLFRLYRNEGTNQAPRYAAAFNLQAGGVDAQVPIYCCIGSSPQFADLDGDGKLDLVSEQLEAGQEPKPGIRSQVAVADYDNDGKLDLLLGDMRTNLHLKANLTPAQRQAFAKALAEVPRKRAAARAALREIGAAWLERVKTVEMKGIPQSEWRRPEHAAKVKKLKEAEEASPAYRAALADLLGKDLVPFMDRPEAGHGLQLYGDPSVAHGYVWLFRRK